MQHRHALLLAATASASASTLRVAQTAVVLEPGLVLLRSAIPEARQRRLYASLCASLNFLTASSARSRVYDCIEAFPTECGAVCESIARTAASTDAATPLMTATHALANLYQTSGGLEWHRDIYKNDGDGLQPIVNLALGAPCRFGLRHFDGRGSREVVLKSGDALVFGGPCRFIEHAVLDVMIDEAPVWMDTPSRMSLTFREAPSVRGMESYYRVFHDKHFQNNQKLWRPGMPLLGEQPLQVGAPAVSTAESEGRRAALEFDI